jgi:hypothetical protein
MVFTHIRGSANCVADLISRWTATPNPTAKLYQLLNNIPIWCPVSQDSLCNNHKIFVSCVAGFPIQLNMFAERVRRRLQDTYRPSTHRSQHTATVALALFCIYYEVAFPAISYHTVLAFIEFLMYSGLAVPTVKKIISSIKSHFKSNNLSIQAFESSQVLLSLTFVSKNWVSSVISITSFFPYSIGSVGSAASTSPITQVVYKIYPKNTLSV